MKVLYLYCKINIGGMVMMDLFAEGYIYIDNCISETIKSVNKKIHFTFFNIDIFSYHITKDVTNLIPNWSIEIELELQIEENERYSRLIFVEERDIILEEFDRFIKKIQKRYSIYDISNVIPADIITYCYLVKIF